VPSRGLIDENEMTAFSTLKRIAENLETLKTRNSYVE
jgi:hypothetical protein